ncbi:MAG: polysaccharide export protein [Candidatus Binatia bacterium]|nr:polysaccharide export protein [Candidatus Binatia bacterium]
MAGKQLFFLVLTVLGVGCTAGPQPQHALLPPASPAPVAQPPALSELNQTLAAVALQAAAPVGDYRIGPEDLLQITLFNVPEGESNATPRVTEARVSQQGVITLPLLGQIPASGRTTAEMEKILKERYATYLRNPLVGVTVKEYRSQRVSVIGAVQRPGVFELTGPKTLIDLLSMAGGVSQTAGRQVHLYRQGPNGRESQIFDLYTLLRRPGADPAELAKLIVQAGDIINVPEAGMFFVDGAVKRPGSFPLNRPYTLSQALSAAGGVDFELAKTSEITVIRRQGGNEIATVSYNFDAIKAGRAPDPAIEAEDVIVVPVSGAKYFVRRFVGSLIHGVSIGSFMY